MCLVASIRPSAPSALPQSSLAVIHIPSHVLPRFVPLPDPYGRHVFVLQEDVIRLMLPSLYTGYDILSTHAIRVTRDADVQMRGRPVDLLASVEESLRERRLGSAVRLQYDADLPQEILSTLMEELELQPEDLYESEGFTAFSDLLQLYGSLDVPRLKEKPQPPHPVPAFDRRAGHLERHPRARRAGASPLPDLRRGHRFVRDAAVDPKVLAIR